MTRAQVGGYEFNYQLNRIRNSANSIRDSLSKIMEGNPGPQTIIALAGSMALQITVILDAITQIEKIGRNTKKDRTTK